MFKMRSLVVRLFNSTIMDPYTYKLIRDLCVEFQLHPDIEFTCYEAYIVYFKRYFVQLEKQFKKTTLECNGIIKQKNQLIDRALDEVDKTSLLHTLALISICAKYINGFRCEHLFKKLSKYLEKNGTPYSVKEIRYTEFIVFKLLGFNIKPSELYSVTMRLANRISRQNRELIQFDGLQEKCITLLRFIYFNRKKLDEILHNVERNTYGYNGNEEYKLSAATLYASMMLLNFQNGNIVLNEIVNLTYLNESLLRKLGQTIHEIYLDCVQYGTLSLQNCTYFS